MDNELKNKLDKVKELISQGKVDDALMEVKSALNDDRFKPYSDALKKIKVDIIYAMNLERINKELGKRAYSRVVSELSLDKNKNPEKSKNVKTSENVKASESENITMTSPTPPFSLMPLPSPVVRVKLPDELNVDPYDLDKINLEHEIGPIGFVNDLRRTFMSIVDPFFPYHILEKTKKKTKKKEG